MQHSQYLLDMSKPKPACASCEIDIGMATVIRLMTVAMPMSIFCGGYMQLLASSNKLRARRLLLCPGVAPGMLLKLCELLTQMLLSRTRDHTCYPLKLHPV